MGDSPPRPDGSRDYYLRPLTRVIGPATINGRRPSTRGIHRAPSLRRRLLRPGTYRMSSRRAAQDVRRRVRLEGGRHSTGYKLGAQLAPEILRKRALSGVVWRGWTKPR